MNEEQVKSGVRWVISTFGGVVAGWFAAKGWFTIDQVTGLLNSPLVISGLSTLGVLIWGLITHTKTNMVAVVDKMPEVAGVVTKPTAAGQELAMSVPSPTVVPAGTTAAADVAKV